MNKMNKMNKRNKMYKMKTPIIEKSKLVTPEICNKAWREGIVTLPDLSTRSIRVGRKKCLKFI